MEKESIINTIHNLLSKTEEAGCTKEEAETASKIVQKLMTRHQIEMSDVVVVGSIGEHASGINGQRIASWKFYLAASIAQANGCKCIKHNDYIKSITFIGHKEDAEMASTLVHHLIGVIDAITKRDCKGKGKHYSTSFRKGMVSSICSRINEGKKQAIRESTDQNAIVKINSKCDEAANWLAEKYNKVKIANVNNNTNRDAYLNGIAAGRSANISTNKLKS